MRKAAVFAASGLVVAASLLSLLTAGCGDDDTTPAVIPGADSGSEGGKDGGSDTGASSSGDTGAPDTGPIPITCTDAELAANDLSKSDAGADGGGLEVTFPTLETPAQYTNRCATIKVGTTVTFTGAFDKHPLEPAGGDSPNPIPLTEATPAGGKLVVSFTKAGVFGYRCEFHPTVMFGAIKVVP